MAIIHVLRSNTADPGTDAQLDRLQARCIREMRDAEVDAAPGGFTVTGESSVLRERILAMIEAEFDRDEGWFELRQLD